MQDDPTKNWRQRLMTAGVAAIEALTPGKRAPGSLWGHGPPQQLRAQAEGGAGAQQAALPPVAPKPHGLVRSLSRPWEMVRDDVGSSTPACTSPPAAGGECLRVGTLNCALLSVTPKDASRVVAIARAIANADLDLVHLSELMDADVAHALCIRVNAACGAPLTQPAFAFHFHSSRSRGAGPSLALFYRIAALADGAGEASRMDEPASDPRLHVNLKNPQTGEVFDLQLRRGYMFRCHLSEQRFGVRPPLTLAGVHLQSNRGSVFSHYKRMAQARIIRAALQPCVLAMPEEDVIVLGDLNSAETDAAIAPLRNEVEAGRSAGLASFTSAVPSAQRTFTVEMLRCLDVRTAGYTLANVHRDGAPTWRRGGASTQYDSQRSNSEDLSLSSADLPAS